MGDLRTTPRSRAERLAQAFRPDPRKERLLRLRRDDPERFAKIVGPGERIALGHYQGQRQAWLDQGGKDDR